MADINVDIRIRAYRPDNSFEDITDLAESITIETGSVDAVGTENAGVDTMVAQADVVFVNDGQLVPNNQNSSLNISGGQWVPLLWPRRRLEVLLRDATTTISNETIDRVDYEETDVELNLTLSEETQAGSSSDVIGDESDVMGDESDVMGDETDSAINLPWLAAVMDDATYMEYEAPDTWIEEGSMSFFDAETSESLSESDMLWVNHTAGTLGYAVMGFVGTPYELRADYTWFDRRRFTLPTGAGVPIDTDTLSFNIGTGWTLDDNEVIFDADIPLTTTIRASYHYFLVKFRGLMGDSIDTEADTIRIAVRDYAKTLQDTYIEVEREYGSESGVPAEDVIQAIIDDNVEPLQSWHQIYVPESPGFMITSTDDDPYYPVYMSVWDAVQEIAGQIGWYLGFRWYDGDFRLTFMEPPRDKTSPDYSYTWDDIHAEQLEISDRDIRNAVKVTYRDKDTGERIELMPDEHTELKDEVSISEYGRRAMEIGEADTSLISTEAEALRLGEAAVKDLADMTGQVRITMPLNLKLELYDAIEVDNPTISSEPMFYGVESLRHTIRANRWRTEVVGSGRVVGAHQRWLDKQTRPGSAKDMLVGGRVRPFTLNKDQTWAGSLTRSASITIAAADSSALSKRSADYVCDGENDSVIFAEAGSATPAGGELKMLRGTYHFSQSVLFLKSLVVRGEGPDTVLRYTGSGSFFRIESDKPSFIDLTFRADGDGTLGLEIDNSLVAKVEHCIFEDWKWSGLFFITGQTDDVVDSRIRACAFKNCGWDADITYLRYAIVVWGDQIHVESCTINDCRGGVYIIGSNVAVADNIIENRTSSIPASGVWDRSDSPTDSSVVNGPNQITNNKIIAHGTGITAQADESTIMGNVVRAKGKTGYGVAIAGDDILITGNDLKNSGTTGDITDAGTGTNFGSGNRLNDGSWDTGTTVV